MLGELGMIKEVHFFERGCIYYIVYYRVDVINEYDSLQIYISQALFLKISLAFQIFENSCGKQPVRIRQFPSKSKILLNFGFW